MYDTVILDLDGVVYIGDHAVEHAIESLNAIASTVQITAATNNAARSSQVVADHLRRLGLDIADDAVVTSAQAGAAVLAEMLPPESRVLAVGGPGVADSLKAAGLHPIRATHDMAANDVIADDVDAVMQGHGVDSAWWDFATAAWAIARGKPWVATNRDQTVPTPYGLAPGNGTFVSAIESAVGVTPIVAGKPEPTLFRETAHKFAAKRVLVIGDRLDTDIDGAIAAGMDSLLVLTGVHRADDALGRPMDLRPTYIAADLRCLMDPSPPALAR